MSKTGTGKRNAERAAAAGKMGPGGMDLAAFDAVTDAQVEADARSDPEAQPMTKAALARMTRISAAKRIRHKLGLSQEAFAQRFQIPLGTLRDWEQHRREPDQAARAYLRVIEREHEAVERALA